MPEQQPIVYILDDDQAVGDALALLLGASGYQVELFACPRVFLESFDAERAGCLLLDIHMPGMSGLEVQRCLNARGVSLPIIFITGHGEGELADQARHQGAVGFIEKPFSTRTLLERVHNVLSGA